MAKELTELKEEIDKLKEQVQKINLWQGKIIGELSSISNKHAYYSDFGTNARHELQKEHPELFPNPFKTNEEEAGVDE